MKVRKLIIIMPWVVVLLWLTMIYVLSAQPATQSNALSTSAAQFIVNIMDKIMPNAEFDAGEWNHFARKFAHFFTYLVLGVMLMISLRGSGVALSGALLITLGVGILVAVSDEVHQFFVLGRGAQVTDVFMDSLGICVGIWTYCIYKGCRFL